MEVEGLLTFEDAAKIIALNIKADIEQAAEATASDYSSETLNFLEQSIFHGVQAAASTPPPLPPNTAPENDLFAENLYYTSNNSDLNASAQYNGNVAYLRWRVGSRIIQNYGFTYDNLDRLTDARFAEYDYAQECPEYLNYGRYDVNIGYDGHRGNISSIDRNGLISGATNFGAIDQINLVNEKNRIKNITESSLQTKGFKGSSGQMGYDNNGNLTNDPSRGITTTYNRLNLPEQITVNNSSFTGTLTFTYDYDGNLLKRVVSQSSPSSLSVTTEYAGGMEYVDGNLQSIYHEEGRYVKNGSNWHHEYVIRDHLGNNRVFFSDTNGDGFISMSEVSQEAHYYPFGMAMQGNWLSTSLPKNKYRYNGIEQTTNLGLDVYNAFYRTLDPSLARWWQVDPAAEKFYGLSPYNSMGNNPIAFADPEGDEIITAILVGAIIGAGINGTITAATGGNFLDGAWKGAVTGALGGGLGAIGGGSFAANLALGTGQGALTGGVGSALNGEDFWEGAKLGAIGGAVMTTVTSENISNAFKGEGFKTNAKVFEAMMERGVDKQNIVDYFGMDATFDASMSADAKFWYRTDGSDYGINLGSSAFDSYDVLKSNYLKESFHMKRYLSGNLEIVPDAYTPQMKLGLEEFAGAKWNYRNQGLYPNSPTRFYNIIKNVESQYLSPFGTSYNSFEKKWWHFMYKIPRRY